MLELELFDIIKFGFISPKINPKSLDYIFPIWEKKFTVFFLIFEKVLNNKKPLNYK